MSEPKNISPLLDGFTMGNPISEHNGVLCCPAIKENTDKKYIVKIISVPPTQAQLDALLLAGAYKDPADAMEYFREIGEDILKEAQLLKDLSKLEGFLPYEGWQMEPITRRRLGYEIYLVGSYKRSLDKYIRKNAITHLEAINLGLDLCAALSVSRQAGFLYVDLKPSNIYISDKKEYRIGDLGFLNLNTLRYASLPDRYYSRYTPPELLDPMASMNMTVDTYAVGMILYQLYNDGHLPFTDKAPEEILPAPVNADYEISEIILKAIHPDPAQRWDDPKELGKALASYMQRNSVNDIPITPFTPLDVKPEDIVVLPKKQEKETDAEEAPEVAESAEPEDAAANTDVQTGTEEAATSEDTTPEKSESDSEAHAPSLDSKQTDEMESETENVPAEELPVSESEVENDDTESDLELSKELSKIMEKAEDLISHEIPEEAVFPEPPVLEDPFAFAADDSENLEDGDIPVDPVMEDEAEKSAPKKKKNKKHYADPTRKNKVKKFFLTLLFLLLLCGVGICGFWYYQNVYLQTIDSITIDGSQNQIMVLIDTKVDESLLTVTCSDNYGKVHTKSVTGGKVTFTDLTPSTLYTIRVDIDGFRKLVGKTSDVFTTEATTRIVSFTSIAGSEDGSVLLNFTVDGEEPDFWNIRYSADGEEEKRETITGHSTTITGLTVGKVYTFTLDGGTNFDLGGETSLQLMASRLILAEDLVVTSTNGSDITVHWNTPGDVIVESWDVRCYNDNGYENQVTVTENQVLFTGIDPSSSYIVEVTASGMTQPARTSITADSISVSEFHMDGSSHKELKVTWDYTGTDPEDGWLLLYTVDGSGSQVVKCDKASAVISPLIPGAKYDFTLQSADSRTIFNNVISYTADIPEVFSEHGFIVEDVTANLLKTPEADDWRYEHVSKEDFTDTFSVNDSASMVLCSSSTFYLPGSEVKVLFVFRDAYGNVLPELVSVETLYWKNMWLGGDTKNGELDIPKIPSTPGNYVLDLYFNGHAVTQFDITITE